MGALDMMVMALIGAASLWLLLAGGRGLAGELRATRRLGGLGASAAAPVPPPLATRLKARGFDRLLLGGSDRADIEKSLRAAGWFERDALAVFVAIRIAAAIAAVIAVALALWLFGLWEGRLRVLALFAGGLAYVAVKLVLQALAKARARRVNRELPFILDMLTMMLEAGISLDQCFRTLAGGEGEAAPEIRRAMRVLVDDIQHGMAYGQALDRWAERIGVPGAGELAGLLRQSLFQGVELGGVLREFSREFTDRRVSAAREAIGRKTAKMAMVMMVFLMPALFIVLCGPAVVSITATLTGQVQ